MGARRWFKNCESNVAGAYIPAIIGLIGVSGYGEETKRTACT